MASWTDRFWYSAEGLRLHYRDYEGPRDKPPILCIPGLTRNARDFEPVAERYAGDWRVICVDLRGRGRERPGSRPSRYTPHYYVADVLKLLDQEGIADAVFFGTSLGAICTMLLASTDADRIAGAMLNDIGPEIDQAGIDRIGGYVGREVNLRKMGRGDRGSGRAQSRSFSKMGRRASGNASRSASCTRHPTASGSSMTCASPTISVRPRKVRRAPTGIFMNRSPDGRC